MAVAGTTSEAGRVIGCIDASSAGLFNGAIGGAVLADQVLRDAVLPFNCRLGGVRARAETAGSGAGTTVLDILKNGTSVWHATGDRPTLAAGATGAFTNQAPDVRHCVAGDRLSITVASVSTTGHARVSCSIALEEP